MRKLQIEDASGDANSDPVTIERNEAHRYDDALHRLLQVPAGRYCQYVVALPGGN